MSDIQIRVAMRLTNTFGEPLVPLDMMTEPNKGSVVLTHGEVGTAWQRHFLDGRWYSTVRGRNALGRDWRWMKKQRNLVLVFDAPEVEGGRVTAPAPPAEAECTCGEFADSSVVYVDCPVHNPAPPTTDAEEAQP